MYTELALALGRATLCRREARHVQTAGGTVLSLPSTQQLSPFPSPSPPLCLLFSSTSALLKLFSNHFYSLQGAISLLRSFTQQLFPAPPLCLQFFDTAELSKLFSESKPWSALHRFFVMSVPVTCLTHSVGSPPNSPGKGLPVRTWRLRGLCAIIRGPCQDKSARAAPVPQVGPYRDFPHYNTANPKLDARYRNHRLFRRLPHMGPVEAWALLGPHLRILSRQQLCSPPLSLSRSFPSTETEQE